jgi:Domain of unknown function (DUF5134)
VAVIVPTVLVAALCLGTGLACLALALARVGDRTAQLTHAAVGVAMAAMLSPWGDPLPAWTGVVGFTAIAAWFAVTARRGVRSTATARHLAISSAALVVMYLVHGHGADMAGATTAGPHAGHGVSGSVGLVVVPLILVLAGYFVWHTWTCVEKARAATGSPRAAAVPAGTRTGLATRIEPVAHGAMSALMAAMFLGAV